MNSEGKTVGLHQPEQGRDPSGNEVKATFVIFRKFGESSKAIAARTSAWCFCGGKAARRVHPVKAAFPVIETDFGVSLGISLIKLHLY
ncbi:MAG: hypothetical protein IPQ00_00080 [Chloracidobacterium sp.]|nr:hypothetical protein [Chloracidobacterium sp.]